MTFKNILAAAGVTVIAGVPAFGATVGFDLTIRGNANVPTFNLTNTSAAADLTSFAFTIGDKSRNFDQIFTITTSAGTSSLTFSSTNQSGARTDSFEISFTGLGVSQTAS